MSLTTPITVPDLSKKQKTLTTLANINSAAGHATGLFGGIALGVNIAKKMSNNGVNSGIATATGIFSALATIALVSTGTELISGALRKKAGVFDSLSMLTEHEEDFLKESTLEEEATMV